MLEKLAGQYELVNELDHRQKQERAEKNALDRRLVDKIDKLKNSFPMEFLFEVGLKGVYENKVRAKMRSIIKGWAYGLGITSYFIMETIHKVAKPPRKDTCLDEYPTSVAGPHWPKVVYEMLVVARKRQGKLTFRGIYARTITMAVSNYNSKALSRMAWSLQV